MKFYELPNTLDAEENKFETDIEGYVSGEIPEVKFKAIRVAHGVYEQRQNDTYMIRIRAAAGGITPKQLKKVAELGEKYGSGEVHFTTRSEIQVHEVLIQNVMKVIRGLREVNLSSRGGGGNTIRNILTSPDSGITEDTIFDVDPYAISLTSRLISEPDSWNLPRKFKIAMSHNSDDTAISQATCLGYVAKIKDGVKGFEVYCAGGMGAKPMVGHLLFEFIPDTKVYHVSRALKMMFDKHGNRRSKFSSRLKFLWKKLDREEFIRLFHEEYDKIKDDESLTLELPEVKNEARDPNIEIETPSTDDFEKWKARYVVAQVQDGLVSIKLPLVLGDLLKSDADLLCDFLDQFGDNTIRCDRDQNMRLRNIPEKYLGNAYNIISKMGYTLVEHAPFIGNMINCTGAQTCKLGICLPRGLSGEITSRLSNTDIDLDAIPDFKLNMSGCPNTCGMHHIADLGFFGKVGRKDGDMYPSYNVLAGAKRGAGTTEYAQRVDEIAAHFAPNLVEEFLRVWVDRKKDAQSYHAFLEAEGNDLIKSICDKYRDIPPFSENETYYTDFGAKRRLSMDEIGTAECSAGVFDMIDVDKKNIRVNKKAIESGEYNEETLYQVLFSASRMLLVTRGLDAKTEDVAFKLFAQHFLRTGIISEEFIDLVTLGEEEKKSELLEHKDQILNLAATVQDLYDNMDDSLRFKSKDGEVIKEKAGGSDSIDESHPELASGAQAEKSTTLEKDFRGVGCPMNFVKTKLALETINSGDKLRVLLDDGEPIQNVPNSVKLEGHKVLGQIEVGPHWEVLIEKA